MNELTENDRKRLTEYLGKEFYNEPRPKHALTIIPNRTFTTWQDFGDLKDRLEEKGEWKEFWFWVWDCEAIKWTDSDFGEVLMSGDSCLKLLEIAQDAPRFCGLVNEWLKEKEAKP